MDKKKLEKSILENMRKEFDDNDIPAKIVTEDISGTAVDILRVQYSDDDDEEYGGIAEYVFMDFDSSADDILYFSGFITLRENVSPEKLPLIMKAAARQNFSLPFGCVLVNEKLRMVLLRLDCRVPMALDRKSIDMIVNTNCAHLIELGFNYSAPIIDLIDGEITYKTFVEIVNQ